ncbi:MAG: DUF4261 domain-containing protein [Cohaesibacter sp.]|nr:DUF4261 domain-containing protein [Cohaesibacter sp.]
MSNQFFSFVLTDGQVSLDLDAIVAKLRGYLTPIGSSLAILQAPSDNQPVILEVGGVKISLIQNASAVPAGTFDTALKFSLAWSEAGVAVAAHKAHIVVGCLELPSNHEQALHFAIMNSLATAAVSEVVSGLGVYWSSAQLLISPDGFGEAARGILNKQLPVEDWINLFWIRGEQEGSLAVGCVTSGAFAFLGMEIEFLPTRLQPADLAQKIFGVFQYLLMNGAVLNDGDTLGQSEGETMRVHFKDHGLQFDGRVLQLTYENTQPAPTQKAKLPGLGGAPHRPASGNGRARQPFGKRGR